jgi:hypothetical protein
MQQDIAHFICLFLYPSERVSLSWCSKQYKKDISWKWICLHFDVIVQKRCLELFGKKLDMLQRAFSSNNMLSGSFLLWCITGTTQWQPDNIDFYLLAQSKVTDSRETQKEE